MCFESRRNLTNVILFCDIKATEPESVDVLDCTLTHILTQCPRAIRVVGICQGQSNVRKAFIFGTPLATLHFEFVFFFFFHMKNGLAPR